MLVAVHCRVGVVAPAWSGYTVEQAADTDCHILGGMHVCNEAVAFARAVQILAPVQAAIRTSAG